MTAIETPNKEQNHPGSLAKSPDQPFVSIIVNCFNGEQHLKEALDSILSQTYQDWELIFWDNQSTDHSASIVQEIDDNRVNYFYADEHTTLGVARNQAFAKSIGEWVTFLDCDDIWVPSRLEELVAKVESSGSDLGLLYSRCEYFLDKNESRGSSTKLRFIFPKTLFRQYERQLSELYSGNFIPFSSTLYLSSALRQIGGIPDYKFCPDYYINLAIAQRHKISGVDATLCKYRIHAKSMSTYDSRIGFEETLDVVNKLAPPTIRHKVILPHVTRYGLHLLKNNQFHNCFALLKKESVFDLLFGVCELARFVIVHRGIRQFITFKIKRVIQSREG